MKKYQVTSYIFFKSAALFFFAFCSTSNAANLSCKSFFQVLSQNEQSIIDSMHTNHGFSKNVALRIADAVPDLAETIMKDPSQAYHSLKIYRGFTIPPFKIDLTGYKKSYFPNSQNGITWFSISESIAEHYTRGGDIYKTILEVEIPRSLFTPKHQNNFPGKNAVEIAYLGYPTGTIDQSTKELANLRPFISRIGIIWKNKTHWLSYEEALLMDLFNTEIDYSQFFNSF